MEIKKDITEKENVQLVLDGKIPQWVPSFTDACAFISSPAVGRVYDEKRKVTTDIYGVEFIATIDGPMVNHTNSGNFLMKDITKWKDYMPKLDLDRIDWEQDAQALKAMTKPGQAINLNAGGIWEQLHYMMGFGEALAALLEEPEASAECLMGIARFTVDALKRVCRFITPDLIMIMDHVATHQGLMMSPETYREIIKPAEKLVMDAIIEIGSVPEIHVDGNVEEILPDYFDMGIKVIQPFQVFNDINAAKEKYGFVAIGGWNAFGRGNQKDSTEEEIRESVRLAIDSYAPGGRYMFWHSGATPAFPGYIDIILDEARVYGHSFYNK